MQQHIVTFSRFLFPTKCSGCNILDKTCKLNAKITSLASNWTIDLGGFAILQYCIYFCGNVQSYLSGTVLRCHYNPTPSHCSLFKEIHFLTLWQRPFRSVRPGLCYKLGCDTNWSNSTFDSSDFSDVTLVYRRDVCSLHYFSRSGKWMHVSVSRFRKLRNQIPSLSGVALATTQAMLFNKKQNCGLQLSLWQQLNFIGFNLCKSEETLERLFRGCGRPWSAG